MGVFAMEESAEEVTDGVVGVGGVAQGDGGSMV